MPPTKAFLKGNWILERLNDLSKALQEDNSQVMQVKEPRWWAQNFKNYMILFPNYFCRGDIYGATLTQ